MWTGAKNITSKRVKTTIEVDGEPWFDGEASCVLVGNVGDVLGGLSVFPEASPDDGRLDIGVVTADGAWEWARTLGRSVVGARERLPPSSGDAPGRTFEVRLEKRIPYELDGGDRKKTKKLKIEVKPGAIIGLPSGGGTDELRERRTRDLAT